MFRRRFRAGLGYQSFSLVRMPEIKIPINFSKKELEDIAVFRAEDKR